MLYEAQNLMKADAIKIEWGKDLCFPPHLHESFEIVTVTEGEMTVTVDKKPYILTKGNAILIFPNQVHEMVTEKKSSHYLCIFSPRLVQSYSKECISKVPKHSMFTPSEFFLNRLISLKDGASLTSIKGTLYSLCGEFDLSAEYAERNAEKEALLFRIFGFVEAHYGGECDLRLLSRELGYNYVYLSRYFKERASMSYTEYVNTYRIDQACYLLGNTDKTIISIAYECGFSSLRSFNRNFCRLIGIPPGEYRRGERNNSIILNGSHGDN